MHNMNTNTNVINGIYFATHVLHNPNSKYSSANEHIQYIYTVGLNVHQEQPFSNFIIVSSLDWQVKSTNHKRPLSKTENALLLSTYTSESESKEVVHCTQI